MAGMNKILARLLPIALLASCSANDRKPSVHSDLDVVTDAVSDAPALDLTTPWTRHVITAGATSGPRRGADGVDINGFRIATAWEEGGGVTIANRPEDPTQPWPTEQVATGLTGVEDARVIDVDGDGVLDVVSASDAGQRVYVSFGNGDGTYTTVDILASHGHNHVMQVAVADIDGDQNRDIVFGTRVGTAANPAVIAFLQSPGFGSAARDGSAWTYHQISLAGWAMSVLVVDGKIVVSDRASYRDAGNVTRWDLYGARWLELVAGTWVNHPISPPAGSCSTCTPGDEMFLRVVDFDHDGQPDVLDCTSALNHPNRVVIHRNLGGWANWSHTVIADVANVGHCQGVAVADFDGDGFTDIAVSGWKGNALPLPTGDVGKSGLWLLHNDGAGGWVRGEISGPSGSKFDNVEVMSFGGRPGIVTSEQLGDDGVTGPAGGVGVVWYEQP